MDLVWVQLEAVSVVYTFNKEAIGATNLACVAKCLSRELSSELEETVHLLFEFSKWASLCEQMGATDGARNFDSRRLLSRNKNNKNNKDKTMRMRQQSTMVSNSIWAWWQ